MLRTIFSVIHSIIDTDKYCEKNNTIYLVSSDQNSVLNMDLKIDTSTAEEPSDSSSIFEIKSDQGDVITCKHFTNKEIKIKNTGEEKLEMEYEANVQIAEKRITLFNENKENKNAKKENSQSFDLQDGENSRIKRLLRKFSDLSERQAKIIEQDRNQIAALVQQVHKMKRGLERLKRIAANFECSEKFKQDIDNLVKNTKFDLENTELYKNLSTKDS